MSRSKKAAIIIAVSCMAIGLILSFLATVLIGFDFTKLSTMNFDTKTYEIRENFQSVDIRDLECDISFVPAADGQCRVVCKESDKIISTVAVENDTLTVTRKDMRLWYEMIGIWWGDDLSVTVYLPEISYQNLSIQSVSGNIEIPDDFAFSRAELVSTSGDIAFMGDTSEDLSIKSTSGNINVKNTAGGPVNAETTSGNIVLSHIATDALTLSTTSGNIELLSSAVNGPAELKTVSGNIGLDRSDAGSFLVKTVSGDVEGNILSTKNFITDTISGDIRVPSSNPQAGDCEIKTTSGNIKVSILS